MLIIYKQKQGQNCQGMTRCVKINWTPSTVITQKKLIITKGQGTIPTTGIWQQRSETNITYHNTLMKTTIMQLKFPRKAKCPCSTTCDRLASSWWWNIQAAKKKFTRRKFLYLCSLMEKLCRNDFVPKETN